MAIQHKITKRSEIKSKNNQTVKKCAALTLKKAIVKKDVESKVAAKKWL